MTKQQMMVGCSGRKAGPLIWPKFSHGDFAKAHQSNKEIKEVEVVS